MPWNAGVLSQPLDPSTSPTTNQGAASQAPVLSSYEWQEPAPAAPGSPFDETFGCRVGGILFGSFRTTASLDIVGSDLGTEVNLEDDLGLSSQGQALRADAWYRFGRAHRIDVAWFDLERSAGRSIDREIHWGGEVFPVHAEVTAELATQILQARYTWNFLAEDDYELGAGIGLYGMRLTAGMRADLLGIEKAFESPVPLPVLALQGAWEFAPHWQLIGSAQCFFLTLESVGAVDEISGSVIDVLLGLEYAFADHFSVGAAYNYFQIDVGAERNSLDLEVEYGYSALFVYMGLKV